MFDRVMIGYSGMVGKSVRGYLALHLELWFSCCRINEMLLATEFSLEQNRLSKKRSLAILRLLLLRCSDTCSCAMNHDVCSTLPQAQGKRRVGRSSNDDVIIVQYATMITE